VSKKYQDLWIERKEWLRKQKMAKRSLAPPIDQENPADSFELVVTLIRMGGEDLDHHLLETFRETKLNIEDPFHWWQLLAELILIHTDGKPGARTKWDEKRKVQLRKDCVRAGKIDPPTDNILEICKRLEDEPLYRSVEPEHIQRQVTRFRLTASIKKQLARFVHR
jgi:hypothetical protein